MGAATGPGGSLGGGVVGMTRGAVNHCKCSREGLRKGVVLAGGGSGSWLRLRCRQPGPQTVPGSGMAEEVMASIMVRARDLLGPGLILDNSVICASSLKWGSHASPHLEEKLQWAVAQGLGALRLLSTSILTCRWPRFPSQAELASMKLV